MRLLIAASLRFAGQHLGQWTMALVGMAAGVAVMSGVWLMQQALTGSIEQASAQLVGQATVRVVPPGGLIAEQVYSDWVLSEGAPDLFPLIEVGVELRGQPMSVLGIDPLMGLGQSHRLAGAPVAGALIGSIRSVVVSDALAERLDLDLGEVFEVTYHGRSISLQVAGQTSLPAAFDEVLVMDISTAQHLFTGSGWITAIEAPSQASDWLEARMSPGWTLLTPQQQYVSAKNLSRGMRTNLMAMSLLALAVGLLVVYAVVSFLLVQRQKTLALMRAIGATRTAIVLQLGSEVLVLALMAGAIGLILGTELASILLNLVRDPYQSIYGLTPATKIQPSWLFYLFIWGFSVLTALLAAIGLLLEAFRVTPAQWVRAQTVAAPEKTRWIWLATLALITGLGLIVFTDNLFLALAGLFLLLAGLSAWLPLLAFQLLTIGSVYLGHGLTLRALMMMLSARQRLTPAVAALGLALALGAGIGMMVLGFRGAVDHWVEQLLQADAYVTDARGTLSADTVLALSQLSPVLAISSVRRAEGSGTVPVLAYQLPDLAWLGFEWIKPTQSIQALDAVRSSFEAGQGVLITEPLANKQGLKVGDPWIIRSPSGMHTLPILAIYRDYASERGSVAIDDTFYVQHWTDAQKDSVGIYLKEGASVAELRAAIDALDEKKRLTLTPRENIRQQTLEVFDETFRISWALAFLVGLIASVALISALLAIGIERGREYATLRALGMTPEQLRKLVILQTLGMAILSFLLAVPLSLIIHAVLSLVIQPLAFGWQIPWQVPTSPWLVTGFMSLVIGLVAGMYPAWRIVRQPPASLLRSLS